MNGQHFKKCMSCELISRLTARGWSLVSLLMHGCGFGVLLSLYKTLQTIARPHLPYCSLYCRIAGCNDSAVSTYVYTRRIYKILNHFVGAKCGWLSVQQVGVAVKWYHWAVMGFSHFGWLTCNLIVLIGLLSKLCGTLWVCKGDTTVLLFEIITEVICDKKRVGTIIYRKLVVEC